MYALPEKLRDLTPYDPITGSYALRCDANESCLPLPEEWQEEIALATRQLSYNRYPDPYATELCRAFADYYGIPVGSVTAANGSDELLALLTSCFLNAGDKLLTLTPEFSMYRFYAGLYEDKSVVEEKSTSLSIDPDAVIRRCREEKAQMLLFSNPCNPTSLGLKREAVRRIIEETDALVVLDEAYMDFWDQSLLEEASSYDNLVILRTASKAVGLASLRLGFAVSNERITRALQSAKSPYNVNGLSQAIGAAVYRHKTLLRQRTEYLIRCREDLQQKLDGLTVFSKVYPSVTNFVYAETPLAKQLHQALLDRSIAVRLMGNALRITAAEPEDNTRIAAAIEEFEKEETL